MSLIIEKVRQFWRNIKERKARRKSKEKWRISKYGRRTTGNAPQRATRNKPKGKYPIQKGENIEKRKYTAKRILQHRRGNGGQQYVEINAWAFFYVFAFSLSAFSIARITSGNTGYGAVSTRVSLLSKYLVHQSINGAPAIKILSISKYQQYVNIQKNKYRLVVQLGFNAEKWYTGTYWTGRTLEE